MSFEERIERLTKRQEALDRQVALPMADNRRVDARISEITAAIAGRNNQRQSPMDERLAQTMAGIARLLHVAEIHEQRIEGTEEGPKQP